MTGAGCPKSSARHRAISSNKPLPQSNLAHCPFLWPASNRFTAHEFCETNLTLPRPLFFTLVSSSLSFHSWIISFIPVINFQVFLFFVFSLLSVFQEHQRKLTFCPVWRLLSPFSIHSFSSPSTYYRLLYCVPSTITCIRWMRVGSCAHRPSIPVEGVRKWTNKWTNTYVPGGNKSYGMK